MDVDPPNAFAGKVAVGTALPWPVKVIELVCDEKVLDHDLRQISLTPIPHPRTVCITLVETDVWSTQSVRN